jgi:hypothetical protein
LTNLSKGTTPSFFSYRKAASSHAKAKKENTSSG